MNIPSSKLPTTSRPSPAAADHPLWPSLAKSNGQTKASPELEAAFQDFVGQTFFSQLIASARTSQQGSSYFNGGQAEKVFQSQLDQVLSEKMSEASGEQISKPMLELMLLPRPR